MAIVAGRVWSDSLTPEYTWQRLGCGAISENGTLLTLAADTKRLGARIGFLAVLPALSRARRRYPSGRQSLECIPAKVFPERRCTRGYVPRQIVAFLRNDYARSKLRLGGSLKPLTVRATFDRFTLD
jgi:hypothetical protein